MKGFVDVAIEHLIIAIGEEKSNEILSDFSSPPNLDVETFLKKNAVLSNTQGFSRTRLVFAQYSGKPVLAGYYTLANKIIVIKNTCKLSKTMRKCIARFGVYNQELDQREVSAPLIAQLGKNFRYKDNKIISGNDLLELATNSVRQALRLLGGRVVYLECEDIPYLIKFYDANGFIVFDERSLDTEERKQIKGEKLIQMIKYFDSKDLGLADDVSMDFNDFMR